MAQEPKPDPARIVTGDRTTVADAGGNAFVVTEPTDKTSPTYAQGKKDAVEYEAQAEKEPLAVKLADSVGNVRVATNFAWTLNTGYLVLFMQAGFALLTCGLVRKKNAGHLMMLSFAAYVFAFIAYYAVGYAFQFGGVAMPPHDSESWRPKILSFPGHRQERLAPLELQITMSASTMLTTL
jgi:Amt family ammonium transporter